MPTDIHTTFYIVLTVAIALLTVFLCVALVYLILILRDSSKVIEKVRGTVETVNSFILKPVGIATSIVEHVRPLIEAALERRAEKAQHNRKKR